MAHEAKPTKTPVTVAAGTGSLLMPRQVFAQPSVQPPMGPFGRDGSGPWGGGLVLADGSQVLAQMGPGMMGGGMMGQGAEQMGELSRVLTQMQDLLRGH